MSYHPVVQSKNWCKPPLIWMKASQLISDMQQHFFLCSTSEW